jgi:predicted DNA-binding transcriptional regulator AlpA
MDPVEPKVNLIGRPSIVREDGDARSLTVFMVDDHATSIHSKAAAPVEIVPEIRGRINCWSFDPSPMPDGAKAHFACILTEGHHREAGVPQPHSPPCDARRRVARRRLKPAPPRTKIACVTHWVRHVAPLCDTLRWVPTSTRPSAPTPSELINMDEIEAEYHVHRATVYRHASRAGLRPFKQVGDRRSYFRRADIEDLLRPRQKDPSAR